MTQLQQYEELNTKFRFYDCRRCGSRVFDTVGWRMQHNRHHCWRMPGTRVENRTHEFAPAVALYAIMTIALGLCLL